MAAKLPHDDKFTRLEDDIRRHFDHDHPYTHFLLMRLREDRAWGRVPALFQSAFAHGMGYVLPLLLLNMGLLAALVWQGVGSHFDTVLLWSDAVLTPLYIAVAVVDWWFLARVRDTLRLPGSFQEYPRLR